MVMFSLDFIIFSPFYLLYLYKKVMTTDTDSSGYSHYCPFVYIYRLRVMYPCMCCHWRVGCLRLFHMPGISAALDRSICQGVGWNAFLYCPPDWGKPLSDEMALASKKKWDCWLCIVTTKILFICREAFFLVIVWRLAKRLGC